MDGLGSLQRIVAEKALCESKPFLQNKQLQRVMKDLFAFNFYYG